MTPTAKRPARRGTCQDCGEQHPVHGVYAPLLNRHAPPTARHGRYVEVCPGSDRPSAEWARALVRS